MNDQVEIQLGRETLRLLAAGGVYCEKRQTLFVADTHFGKDATFRRNAIPVPNGSTHATASILSAMLEATHATHLVFLGDLFHDPKSLSADVRETLDDFLARHGRVEFTLVRGNHDRWIRALPSSWKIAIAEPPLIWQELGLTHHPGELPEGAEAMLCGHVHPAVRLGSATDRIKLPCFWLRGNCLVLPAVGQFTGTEVIQVGSKDRAWMIADGQLFERSTRPRNTITQ